jgi:hypothetical protein
VKTDLRNVATSDRLIIDASYQRLKNVQLAYNLPASLSQKLSMSRASVYVSATESAHLFQAERVEPGPRSPSGRATYYPQTALYTFVVNIQF